MKFVYIIISMLLSVVYTSCVHKELYVIDRQVVRVCVAFDWSEVSDASPDGMCVFFYPTDNDEKKMMRFDMPGKDGGEIELPVGKYKVLCYNNDTESVLFRGVDLFETHEGYTRDCGIFEGIGKSEEKDIPRAEGTEDERIVITPDMMCGDAALDVEITQSGINYESKGGMSKDDVVTDKCHTIVLYPHEMICTYTYEVRNVKNLKYAIQMCGSLSGMASSEFFATEDLGSECVTHPFDAVSDGNSLINGSFYTFGCDMSSENRHMFVLYVWMSDGSKYYYTFDVTDMVRQAKDRRHVHLVIDGLELPQPIGNDGGFAPSVDGWQNVEEDIII